MVLITEELIRKRAEHNECEISTLEEISLHQQDIEKIEYLDKWCRKLKILLLQNNLIPKIENLSRLKELQYLNVAINNVERIENLSGCERLEKLDLTLNFIGQLTSVGNLKDNYNLKDLYLTGNPCTQYEGYRDYVCVVLPQLQKLDGEEINKSNRLRAFQNFPHIQETIEINQKNWFNKRKRERKEYQERLASGGVGDNSNYWNEKTAYTPESRLETHEYVKKQRNSDKTDKLDNADELDFNNKPRKLFASDGRPYNINQPQLEFKFTDDEKQGCFLLDLSVYKYMDTSLLECDVQVNYVRVTIKKKIFQLSLPESISPDSSSAQRSTITGHMLITMPKENFNKPITTNSSFPAIDKKRPLQENHNENSIKEYRKTFDSLSDETFKHSKTPIWNDITSNKEISQKSTYSNERTTNEGFIDDPDVPPLI